MTTTNGSVELGGVVGVGDGESVVATPAALSDDRIEFLIHFEFVVSGLMLTSVGVLGLMGNLMSLAILSRPEMKSSINVILIGLTTADSVLIVTSVLMFSLPAIHAFSRTWFETYFRSVFPYITPLIYPVGMISQTGSAYLTIGVAIERYVAVCMPLQSRRLCTYRRAAGYAVLVAVFATAYNIPRLFEVTWRETDAGEATLNADTEPPQQQLQLQPKSLAASRHSRQASTTAAAAAASSSAFNASATILHAIDVDSGHPADLTAPTDLQVQLVPTALRTDATYVSVYITWMYLIVMYVVPFASLAILNFKIYAEVRRSNLARSHLTTWQQKQLKLATMLLVVVAVFFVGNIGALVVNLLELAGISIAELNSLSNLLVTANSSVNFVIYCIYGDRFRRIFVGFFCSPWASCCGLAVGQVGGDATSGGGGPQMPPTTSLAQTGAVASGVRASPAVGRSVAATPACKALTTTAGCGNAQLRSPSRPASAVSPASPSYEMREMRVRLLDATSDGGDASARSWRPDDDIETDGLHRCSPSAAQRANE